VTLAGLSAPTAGSVSPAVAARGRVSTAPASVADGLEVALIGYTSSFPYEVPAGNWDSRGATLPIVGSLCLVVFDNEGDAWVPVWEGVDTPDTSGGSTGGRTFTFTQLTAQTVWTINHGLNCYPPVVAVQDSAGTVVEGDVTYVSANRIVITFQYPQAGSAYVTD